MKESFLKIRDAIRDKALNIWSRIVKYFWAFVNFWRNFPRDFVAFWKSFGHGVANFFRELPETLKSKDKTIDLLIGAGAVITWVTPIGVVIYVLTWFLTK